MAFAPPPRINYAQALIDPQQITGIGDAFLQGRRNPPQA